MPRAALLFFVLAGLSSASDTFEESDHDTASRVPLVQCSHLFCFQLSSFAAVNRNAPVDVNRQETTPKITIEPTTLATHAVLEPPAGDAPLKKDAHRGLLCGKATQVSHPPPICDT